MWDEITNRKADYLYSAVMLNTDITYRTINELEERNVFRSYRDFYNKVKHQIELKDERITLLMNDLERRNAQYHELVNRLLSKE